MGFGSFVSDITGPVLEYIGSRERNKAAEASSARQMDFQERMSGTAHQREVADLKAAGLNPILSAGGGASSPSGASYVPENVFEGISNTALARERLKADLEAIKAGVDKTREDTNLSREAAASQRSLRELQDVQKREVAARSSVEEAAAFSAGNRARIEMEHPDFFGWAHAIMPLLGQGANTAASIAGTGAAVKYLRAKPVVNYNKQNPFKVRRRPE